MARKFIDKIVYHITVKPKRYKPVKDPPQTMLGKILHPQKARQEQYNQWCERIRGTKKAKTKAKRPTNALHTPSRLTWKKQDATPKKQPTAKKVTDSTPRLSLRERILLLEMKRKKLKFTLEDILFIARDKTGQLIWLEKGNQGAGLQHILDGNGKRPGHAQDFFNFFGIQREEIPGLLNRIMTDGKVEYSIIKTKNGREGFERMYTHNGKYYILSGIGKNGYIVSAYPIKEKSAAKLIRINKGGQK